MGQISDNDRANWGKATELERLHNSLREVEVFVFLTRDEIINNTDEGHIHLLLERLQLAKKYIEERA